jgi:hypothetical protein
MLLTKKKSFCIEEATVKREVTDGENCLVRINLRYPDLVCGKKDCMQLFAKDFYKNIADAFEKYATDELVKKAKTAYAEDPEGFKPFSALMKYEVTRLDEKFLSVMTDISVCDGKNPPSVERKTQVWERDFGTKCKAHYFMPKKDILLRLSEALEKDDMKRTDLELFVLRQDSLEFFLRGDGDYRSVVISLQKNG